MQYRSFNISPNKGKQTIKCSQWIEYNKRDNFLYKLSRKWSRKTSSIPLCVFWKCFIRGKRECSAAWFQYIWIAWTWHRIKKTLWNFKLLIQRYAQFLFFRKGSRSIFSITFCEKCFSWYILLINSDSQIFIVRFPLLCEIF